MWGDSIICVAAQADTRQVCFRAKILRAYSFLARQHEKRGSFAKNESSTIGIEWSAGVGVDPARLEPCNNWQRHYVYAASHRDIDFASAYQISRSRNGIR